MDERLRIKELAAEDRPREKMLLKGASSLSDAELIALLIGSGNSHETAVQLAQRILSSVGNNLHTVGKLTLRELMAYRGIGEAKAVTIVAAMELGRRRGLSEPPERPLIRSSEDAFRLFYPLLCDLPHEELRAAFIGRSGKVIEQAVISRGGNERNHRRPAHRDERGNQYVVFRHYPVSQSSVGEHTAQPAGRPPYDTTAKSGATDGYPSARPYHHQRQILL